MARKMKTYLDNMVCALCVTLLTVQPVLAQSIVSDGSGPVVIETANGTTMVMLNTPDANGVSHNTFVEFGVGADGAILNNLDGNETPISTQLGGIIQGNGNLTGGSASIIINEVTTNNPSLLNGYLEVGGQRANVIVANPYGITCDGCGFINTDRLTMTTGTPTFADGDFTGLSVDGGAVNIGAGGLDASDTTRFDLISRQISVAGAVQGQRIRVIAGRNDVIYATGEITEKADDGSTKPTLAIDSTVMGGMFANAITITSTEDGVGVRVPENMASNAGGMVITADGRLVMRSASATENVTIQSTADVVIEQTVVAQQNIEITTPEDLILAANAELVADSAAVLQVGNLTVGANAELAAGTQITANIDNAVNIANQADVISRGSSTITANTITNGGTIAATGGALRMTTAGDLVNTGLAFGDTSVVLRSDAEIFNNGGEIVTNGDVTIRGDDNGVATAFTNQYGGLVETITGDISIAATDINNLRERPLVDGDPALSEDPDPTTDECSGDTCFDPITVAGQITVVGEAAQIISAGNITLTGTDVVNAYSLISATRNIDINADTLENLGLNVYRDVGGTAEFVGAVFGTIEARGDINGTNVRGYVSNGAFDGNAGFTEGPTNVDLTDTATDVINNSDLLVESTDPDSEFLVETRPEFVDLDQFISSDYFLEAIEYNPELRRFGDAYAEALYIRKQLQALLGQLILTAGGDERAQIQAMYDNAIDAQANLDLAPGVALTPDQIGALTSDIIWLEETEVNGEIVLAPKVYLANPEIRFAGLSGATITGRDVTFTTGNFDNAGAIRASNNVSIIARDTFRSISGSVSAENILVNADTIEIATDARRVVTAQGTNLIKLPIFRSLLGDRSYTDNEDRALRTSTFEAGSTIVLTARDTITTTGARIAAGDNITLVAGGDITIGALALASETGRTSGSNRNRVERFDHLTTSLTAGGDITIVSSGNRAGQNDIVLEGANLQAGGNVGLIAQDGDLILAAVSDVYFRDYARKSGNFFRKKIRRSQTLNVTNQVTSITSASITGVAANNILVEGSRFDIPGVPNSDLAPGQLSLVSVNGSSAFTAPTNVRARSSYKSTAFLGGLITNSRDKRSLITESVGTVANTAGDIALNSGADLTLTSVDFTAGGEFVTQVTGTTYLLAAIDVEYHALVEHKDNGVIMTDIRSEDLTESVTFNAIQAATGVNFDINSQIVLAGVRNPLIDSVQAGGWTADNEDSGRFNIADAYLGGPDDDDATDDADANHDPHWREGGEWSEEGEFVVSQVALPTGADGAQYAYLSGVLGRDSTINDPIELVSYNFYEKEQALSPAFKALLTIAVTQGLAGVGGLAGNLGLVTPATAATATTAATAASVTTMGLAVNAAAASTIVGVIDGAVAGDIDVGKILGEAAFSGVSAGLTANINLDTLGGDLSKAGWANTSAFNALGFGEKFTIAQLVESGIDATLTAGLTVTVYEDVDFLDSFGASLKSSTVNLVMADLQNGIGGLELGEGSVAHATLHGLVGCAAAEALDGDCASGAAAAVAMSVYSGMQDGNAPQRSAFESDRDYLAAHNVWKTEIADQAQLVGASVGYVTSSGLAANVSNGASISQSGILNNYLKHDELALAKDLLQEQREAMGACTFSQGYDESNCGLVQELELKLTQLELVSRDNTLDMVAACTSGDALMCSYHQSQAQEFLEWRYGGWINNTGRFDVGAENIQGDIDWGGNLDALMLDVYGRLQSGEISSLAVANAELNNRIIKYDGRMNVGIGGLAVAGVVITCGASAGTLCAVAGGAALIGSADEAADGIATLFTGEAIENPYEAIGEAAGLSEAQARQLESWLDAGAMIVELGAGGIAIFKSGKLVGTVDDLNGGAPVVRVVDDATVAPNRTGNVVEGEVGRYQDLAQRSVKDGLTPDHVPSYAATRQAVDDAGLDLSDSQLRALRNNTNCVVVRTCDHQAFSRTYGGRNNPTQIQTDAQDLRRAADADLDTWEPVWRQNGWTDVDVSNARRQVHEYNRRTFDGLGIDYGSN